MKTIFFLVAFAAPTFSHVLLTQDTQQSGINTLLTTYYQLKNALIRSNRDEAGLQAAKFLKIVKNLQIDALPAHDKTVFSSFQGKLTSDAEHLSESKDLEHQREAFANLSTHLFDLAKAVKLTDQPIYYDYCPMKKKYWLSAEPAIKNPYFGREMLSCGKVSETITN